MYPNANKRAWISSFPDSILRYFIVLIFVLIQLTMLQSEQWHFEMPSFPNVIFISTEIAAWRNLTAHRPTFKIDEDEWIILLGPANLWSENYDYEGHEWVSSEDEFAVKETYFLIFRDHRSIIPTHFFHLAPSLTVLVLEDPYLMKRRALRDAEKRAKKKEIRKQNIKKGSESPYRYRDEAHNLIRGDSEALRKGLPRIQTNHGFR